MATDVYYNGVWMHNVLTREWRQEVEYDESGTDAIFSRFYLEFDGLIHLQTALTISGGSTGGGAPPLSPLNPSPVYTASSAPVPAENATQLYRQIQACLWEPRQLLTVWFGGNLALRALHVDAGTDPDCDVDNGPKPKLISLTQVVGNTLFRVRFAIEVAKVECCSDVGSSEFQLAQPPELVLSNRWSIAETMDDNFYVTRTVRGKIRTSQSMSANLFSLKPAIMPTLEAGFKRAVIDFEVLPNGLEADYTVVDRQVHTAAPFPATKISGHFVESTQMATMRFSELHVRLEAPPNVDKRVLMQRCAQIAVVRLGNNGSLASATGYPEEVAFVEEIGELNAIELRIRMNKTAGSDTNNGSFLGNLPMGTFGLPLQLPGTPTNYDPAVSPVPWFYGYTSGSNSPRDPTDPSNPAVILYAMRCFLQTPCDANHQMAQLTGLIGGTLATQKPSSSDVVSSVTTVQSLPSFTGSSQVNESATQAVYRYYHYSSCYKIRRLKVGLPVAGDITNLTDDATKFVSLGRPQAVRVITVDGERVGQPPNMPAPDETYTDGAITGNLLDHHVEGFPTQLTADGTQRVYRLRGYYVYGLNRSPLASESLLLGKLPFSDNSEDAERFNPSTVYAQTTGPGDNAGTEETE